MKKLKKMDLSSIQNGEAFDSLKLSSAELSNLVGGCWCCSHGAFCGGNSGS